MIDNYCPACGDDQFNSSNGNRYDCRSCGHTLFMNCAGTVGAVIRCGNEILLTLRAHEPATGKLDLPGGFVDPDETFEQALARELLEELNLSIEQPRYLFSACNTYLYQGVHYKTVDAIFELCYEQKPSVEANDDVAAIRWLQLAEINDEDIAFVSVQSVIDRLKAAASSGPTASHENHRDSRG